MTEDLIISKDKDSSFRKACEACKIDFELISEGQDGDKYRVTFDRPLDLYYLSDLITEMQWRDRINKILKN